MSTMKYVEFELVIAHEKHFTNPSLHRGTVEEAITMQMPYTQANEGMLIHLNRSELTDLRFVILTLNCEKNLMLDCKLTSLHHIRNSNRSFN